MHIAIIVQQTRRLWIENNKPIGSHILSTVSERETMSRSVRVFVYNTNGNHVECHVDELILCS